MKADEPGSAKTKRQCQEEQRFGGKLGRFVLTEEMTPLLLPGGEFVALVVRVQVGMESEFPVQGRVNQDLGYHHALVHCCLEQAQEHVALVEVRRRDR